MSNEPRPFCSETGLDSPSPETGAVGQSAGKAPLATEGGHWYLPSGEPFYTVPRASGKGTRDATIADARKVGAVPSVTTILKSIAAPGLQRYFERQIFDAVLEMEWGSGAGDSIDALFAKACVLSRVHSKTAADKGTALHGEIERFLLGAAIRESYTPHITAIMGATSQYGLDIGSHGRPEKSFAHALGFGGKVDYHERAYLMPTGIVHPDGRREIHGVCCGLVIDFKSKPKIEPGKRYGYSNHAMQLAAYREGLGMPNARCINVFVGVEDAKVLIHEWPDADLCQAWQKFQYILGYWQLENNYKP